MIFIFSGCNCNKDGRKNDNCDLITGQCSCKYNFMGQRCYLCADGYNDISQQCHGIVVYAFIIFHLEFLKSQLLINCSILFNGFLHGTHGT